MESVTGGEYWCHQCNCRVRCSGDNGQDIRCPLCDGGFLEELESHLQETRDALQANLSNMDPRLIQFLNFQANPILNSQGGGNSLVQLFDTLLTTLQGFHLNINNNSDEDAESVNANANEPSNPTVVIQRRVFNLPIGTSTVEPGGVQLVFENRGDGTQTNLPGTFGDYFMGPSLEMLIQHLAENDPSRYGSPPTSKAAIEALPTVQITEHDVSSEHSQCAICLHPFELGTEVRQLPCKHIYHSHCIFPWLELHSTCPMCRYELPADGINDNINIGSRPNQQEQVGSAAPDNTVHASNLSENATAAQSTEEDASDGGNVSNVVHDLD